MKVKKRYSERDVRQWMGQPVCVELRDGSRYVGYITKVDNGSFRLAGPIGRKNVNRSSTRRAGRARVSGFFPWANDFGFGGGFGGGLGGGFGGGGMNLFGANPGFGAAQPGWLGQNGGAGGGLGGIGGLMGMFKKYWPGIQMGIGMIKTIMPLLGGLKI
ncbi:hypothetical protein J19TS2_59260 [Cohnella xylanilytica]|uniref:Uncharacterized protein n=1 Tax=Cohnella xylanilytica TaxID=557555 RepID=A0A841TWM9_9BACL|nr:hypothetical protein [Cohnella xylanilytica]MBB6692666.1 hypothetical protein [Cohnella xylanilytica]GIO16371.1 hypothetical protein J19TS2_59260 [Cohnella xylanilytica]